MPAPAAIKVTSSVHIPLAELTFRATRSGGPGGQHVNTSSTRVELWWDAAGSPSLSPAQRARVLAALGGKLTEDGQLRIVSSETRSQSRNRDAAMARFRAVLAGALAVRKARRPTRPPRAVKERRLKEKRVRSTRKQERRRPVEE
jgi:ribosome-associated protein